MNTDKITDLLERVESVQHLSARLLWEVYQLADIQWENGDPQRRAFEQVMDRYIHAKAFTEAALYLVERTLGPAAVVCPVIEIGGAGHACRIDVFEGPHPFIAEGRTPALAIITALLKALKDGEA